MFNIGYTVGVFDKFHFGHKNVLLECSKMCKKLIIGIHTDEFTKNYKRLPSQNQNIRKKNIVNFLNKDPNEVIIIDDNHIDLIKKYGINVIFHGNDWDIESYKKQIRYYRDGMDKLNVKIKIIDYTKGISTTKILNGETLSLKSKKCFLFDLDNTLILNDKLMKFSKDIIYKLKMLKKDIYIISNNNRYSIDEISMKIIDLDFDKNKIITPLIKIVKYLKLKKIVNIFVWGTDTVCQYFVENKFNLTEINPELIIVLYNNKFNYMDLVKLINLINNTSYIIGNIDPIYPNQDMILPDTGCLWKYIEFCTNKMPVNIFGKPNKNMINELLLKYDKKDIIFIGDSKITDYNLAKNCNIDFIHINEQEGDISHLGVLCDYL